MSVISDSGDVAESATPVEMQTLTIWLMWFQMLSKELLSSGADVTVLSCGKELGFHFVKVVMLYGRLIRKAEQ